MADWRAFLEKYGAAAKAFERQTGIPALWTLAMGINETGGNPDNPVVFGIKAPAPSGRYENYRTWEDGPSGPYQTYAKFGAYDTPDEAWQHLGMQSVVRGAPTTSAEDFFNGLKSKGWATDRDYVSKLTNIVSQLTGQDIPGDPGYQARVLPIKSVTGGIMAEPQPVTPNKKGQTPPTPEDKAGGLRAQVNGRPVSLSTGSFQNSPDFIDTQDLVIKSLLAGGMNPLALSSPRMQRIIQYMSNLTYLLNVAGNGNTSEADIINNVLPNMMSQDAGARRQTLLATLLSQTGNDPSKTILDAKANVMHQGGTSGPPAPLTGAEQQQAGELGNSGVSSGLQALFLANPQLAGMLAQTLSFGNSGLEAWLPQLTQSTLLPQFRANQLEYETRGQTTLDMLGAVMRGLGLGTNAAPLSFGGGPGAGQSTPTGSVPANMPQYSPTAEASSQSPLSTLQITGSASQGGQAGAVPGGVPEQGGLGVPGASAGGAPLSTESSGNAQLDALLELALMAQGGNAGGTPMPAAGPNPSMPNIQGSGINVTPSPMAGPVPQGALGGGAPVDPAAILALLASKGNGQGGVLPPVQSWQGSGGGPPPLDLGALLQRLFPGINDPRIDPRAIEALRWQQGR